MPHANPKGLKTLKPERMTQFSFTDITGKVHTFIGEYDEHTIAVAKQQADAQAPATHGDMMMLADLLREILIELRASRAV